MTPQTMSDLAANDLAAVKVFKALGDPTRFRVVRMLAEQAELGCGDLSTTFSLSAPALSHHTRILQECGLIAVRREGSHHYFRLRKEQLERFAPGLLHSPAAGIG